MKSSNKILLASTLALALLATACSTNIPQETTPPNPGIQEDGCTALIVATSSEKVNLMQELGEKFKDSPEMKALDTCVTVYPINVSSGKGAEILSANPSEWPNLTEDQWPTVWSPASTVWTDRVTALGNGFLVENPVSFAKTPYVFGMPESMADALGYPETPISINTIESYIADPNGWTTLGKPLWGSFKIAKTNPNTSTTGLSMILMQAYAAAGKTEGLTVEDIAAAEEFSRTFESGAIHYGDTTGKILNTLYNESRGSSSGSSYVSAIALEETSLFNYNLGNPDSHTVQPGEVLTPPKEKLVAVYPSGGTLWSDNPVVVLGSSWVSPAEKAAGDAFVNFLQTRPAQEILPKYGFRPIDETIDISSTMNASVGIDPAIELITLEKPSASVVSAALDQWTQIRKPSAVLELIDISGSMDDGIGDGRTKLEGAIDGARSTLNNFRSTDEIGVWAFTTDISSDLGANVVSVRDFGPLEGDKESTRESISDLLYSVRNGTPLYDSIAVAYDYMKENAEPGRINAIVVLSDGEDTDSALSLDSLVLKINEDNEGVNDSPVRIFTIAYGENADTEILARISEASGGQMFDATDPTKIDAIFQSVMNNF